MIISGTVSELSQGSACSKESLQWCSRTQKRGSDPQGRLRAAPASAAPLPSLRLRQLCRVSYCRNLIQPSSSNFLEGHNWFSSRSEPRLALPDGNIRVVTM